MRRRRRAIRCRTARVCRARDIDRGDPRDRREGGGYSHPGGNARAARAWAAGRSEEPTSELQSLLRISYAVFCLKTKQTRMRRQHILTPGYQVKCASLIML